MSYFPAFKVEAAPLAGGGFSRLRIAEGEVVSDMHELAREFSFSLPQDHDYQGSEYQGGLLERGCRLKVTTTMDGSFAVGSAKLIFDGALWQHSLSREAGEARVKYTAYCPLIAARAVGVNVSRATRMLLYYTTFTTADFDPSDPHFLAHIPDTSPGTPNEFVPHGIVTLSAAHTDGGGEYQLHEYGKDEYEYSASRKQLYFTSSQEDFQEEGRSWIISLYYYDPADLSNTVRALLTLVATGAPWSSAGGLGFAPAQVDLEEIVSFDGVSPKKIRSILFEKTDGPIAQLLDELRDQGLLPRNYWLHYDPVIAKLLGRHLLQDSNAPYLLPRVLNEEEPATLEGVAGRVEVYSDSVSPENYALGATVSLHAPDNYAVVGAAANVNDGKPGTFIQLQRDNVSLSYPVTKTPVDCLVLDLGEVKPVARIQLRGTHPMEPAGDGWRDIPLYHISRLPKLTVSASMDPINAGNPGIPVSPDAVSAVLDPQNVGASQGLDLDVECTLIRDMRYVAIRWEQDLLFRRSDKITLSGTVKRQSWFGLSEIKILGDSRYRYRTDPYKGSVPFAQITGDPADPRRYMRDLAGSLVDLYFPQLYRKLSASSWWLEILDDNRPADIEEAEALAVERLLELIGIAKDRGCEIALDHAVEIGKTVRSRMGSAPWLVTAISWKLNGAEGSDRRVPVTMQLSGSNFEEGNQ
jgi:hypothetical protein